MSLRTRSILTLARPCLVSAALCLALAATVQAQTAAPATPSTQDIIDKLKAPAAAPATRSLGTARNFRVVPTEAPADAGTGSAPPAERPNVSLAIEFDFGSAHVRGDSQAALNNLAQALNSPALQGQRFLIEGHTDATGRADYNQRLSAARAAAVSAVLVAQGVDKARLQAVGKGSTEPVDVQNPEAAANRRVRVVNLD